MTDLPERSARRAAARRCRNLASEEPLPCRPRHRHERRGPAAADRLASCTVSGRAVGGVGRILETRDRRLRGARRSSRRRLPDGTRYLPSAMRLVRDVEDYLRTAGTRPVHVSEICTELRLSRRSLHRAFHEVFGVGPVTFLRYKRLYDPFDPARKHAGADHRVQGRDRTGLHRARTLLAILPRDVRGVPVADAWLRRLKRDDIWLNRHRALALV